MNKIEDLQKLKELLDSGVLTQEEFESEKEKILNRPTSTVLPAKVGTNITSWEANLKSFLSDSQLDDNASAWFSTKLIQSILLGAGLVILIVGFTACPMRYFEMFAVSLLGTFLLVCASRTKGILPKVIPACLTLTVVALCFSHYNKIEGSSARVYRLEDLNWSFFYSLGFVLLMNLFMPKLTSVKKRVISTFLLAIPLNPTFWALNITGAVKIYRDSFEMFVFYSHTTILAALATIATLFVYYLLVSQIEIDWKKYLAITKDYVKKIPDYAVRYKKWGIVLVVMLLLGFGISHWNDYQKQKAAEQLAIEQARQDSIDRVERAEQARLAAIEQARQDSIDKVEHAAFVRKYENIGLIITDVGMISGRDSDGDTTKGIRFSIFNPTSKTIKYVTASMVAINGVGDVMSYEKTCRGIGPVPPYETGEWRFDDVFYDKNDIIDDLRVSFRVIYTNGTSKSVRLKDAKYDSYIDDDWFR